MRCALAEHVRLLGNIAVTFGILVASSSIDAGFGNLRFEVSRQIRSVVHLLRLLAKSQASHYLVVTLNVCSLQIIQQTPALRDHLEQAAPRVVIFFVDFEVFGKLVDSLAEQSYLNLWRARIRIVAAKIVKNLYFRFLG